ncbi:hypothetical protein [uncultured Chryseobacterium sp.]|uniref:hypothetical protein n=1 Tax=uncultured Chryseobacterium sp. TaxID=259322 RepID=UPI0025E21CB8|nr:hypothetical protein [uncultured Chryseobacterium sp.]
MIEFIMMLIALAFGNNTANTQSCHNNNGTVTVQLTNPGSGTDPVTGTDPGTGEGDTGGDTGPVRPPKN